MTHLDVKPSPHEIKQVYSHTDVTTLYETTKYLWSDRLSYMSGKTISTPFEKFDIFHRHALGGASGGVILNKDGHIIGFPPAAEEPIGRLDEQRRTGTDW